MARAKRALGEARRFLKSMDEMLNTDPGDSTLDAYKAPIRRDEHKNHNARPASYADFSVCPECQKEVLELEYAHSRNGANFDLEYPLDNPSGEAECIDTGMHLNAMHCYADAYKCFRKALEINPENSIAYMYLGILMDNLERPADGIQYFEKSIDLKPDPECYYAMGHALNNCRRHRTAIKCLRTILRKHPDYADAHYEMATSYMALRDYKTSIECYKRAIKCDPMHKKAHEYLGIAYLAIDADLLAKKYLDKALKIAPGDPDVLEMLDILKQRCDPGT